LLIVCIALQTALIRTDAYIIDAALRPRERVIFGAVSVVATLGLGIVLTRSFGIVGLCIALLVGRAIQSVAYPLIVHNCLERPKRHMAEHLAAARLGLTTALLFAAANFAGRLLLAPNWAVWLGAVLVTLAFVTAFTLFVGPTPTDRRLIVSRVRAMARGLQRNN
jgi:O-antigen/teichoic acid export membrane protein